MKGPVRRRLHQLVAVARRYEQAVAKPFRPLLLLEAARLPWVRMIRAFPEPSPTDPEAVVRHLFIRWPVPSFLIRAIGSRTVPLDEQRWALRVLGHLGRGQSLASGSVLPVPLTRRMRHMFVSAPASDSPVLALRRAQMVGAGADPSWVDQIARTPLRHLQGTDSSTGELWWHRVLVWMAQQPVETEELPELIHWFSHMRWSGIDPMRRPLAAVRRQARQYAEDRKRITQTADWQILGMPDYETREGGRRFTIQEITTPADLLAEGRELAHCANGYLRQLRVGEVALFSLRQAGRRMGTIELRRSQVIHQAKGRANVRLNRISQRVIVRWARARGLMIETPDLVGSG